MRFRADQHLRRTSDFNHVRTQGRRFDCGAFVLYYAPRFVPQRQEAHQGRQPDPAPEPVAPPSFEKTRPTSANPARAGFVASRSAVGNAVERARAKRRLRERFRAHQTAFPAGLDLVFVAKRTLNRLEPTALDQRFLELCRKLFPSRAS